MDFGRSLSTTFADPVPALGLDWAGLRARLVADHAMRMAIAAQPPRESRPTGPFVALAHRNNRFSEKTFSRVNLVVSANRNGDGGTPAAPPGHNLPVDEDQ